MMPAWRTHAACQELPDDWWHVGDPGNRLALLICHRRCSVRADCQQPDPGYAPPVPGGRPPADKAPHTGVIRGGVAYNPDQPGRPLPVCACGYPYARNGGATACGRCDPPHNAVRWWSQTRQQRTKKRRHRARRAAA